jgi:hypothetical protein
MQKQLTFVGAIVAALVLGSLLQPIATSDAQSRFGNTQQSTAPTQFESGSERSLPVLQEIAATLRRIDARLERLESKALPAPQP